MPTRHSLCFSMLLAFCFFMSAMVSDGPMAQGQSEPSKEYIYLNGRLLAITTPGPLPVSPAAGIYAWWAGDGDSADCLGTNNGTISGATFAPGKVGQAFSFDGVDDFVDIPTINLGSTFSVELWVYPTAGTSSNQGLLSNASSSSNYGDLRYDGNSNLISYYQAGVNRVSTPSGSVPQNAWSHIALTYDGYLSRLYVDGILLGTSSSPYVMAFNNPLRLGWTVNGSNSHFKGLMDEVSLYDRALSPEEIEAIFDAGSLGKAKYQFNINTTTLPTMFVGNPASYHIDTVYGTSPVAFSLTSGTLPPGLTLSTSGVVSGTPTTEGNFTFTVQGTDAVGLTASGAITVSVLTALVPPSGLVSWWPGDGDANDIVGVSNGTFQNGAQYHPSGKVAGAFWMNGDDYVDVPSIDLGNSFSVELWVYPTSGYSSAQGLVSNASSSSNYGDLRYDGNSNLISYYQAGVNRVSTASGSVPQYTWSHVALTYDGYLSRLYVDGVLLGTSNSPYVMAFNNPLRFGWTVNGGNYHFKGLMDEVSLYDRALSVEEIQAIFNAGSLGKAKHQFNIDTTTLPTMFVGNPASYQIDTVYGTSPIVFILTSGTLPPGLTLSTSGVVSGAPTTEGNFSFTVQATDAVGLTASRATTVSVLTALVPPSGLVSWWPGDGDANDIVGVSNGTFQNGAQYHPSGKVAGAFWMDGTNDYVDVPSINLGNSFSVELWVYPTGGTSSNQGLVSNASSSSNYGDLRYDGNSRLISYYQVNSNRVSTPSGSVPQNTWSHVALTYDGYLSRLYVDGVLLGTSSSPCVTAFNNPLRLGWTVNGSNSHFKGLMDEVSLYDRALSAEEIQAIFNAGSLGKAKYQFNINTTTLPTMFVGTASSYQIRTTFATNPVTFNLISGALPPGMNLSSAGAISGTPTSQGNYSFTVQAVDSSAQTAIGQMTVSVVTALTPPVGLVHWWPGDGNASDIIGGTDGSPQGGATYYFPGKVAGSFWLDGVDDYIDVPSMNVGNTFSVEFWLYPMRTGYRENLVSNSYSGSNFGLFSFLTNHVEFQQNSSTRVSSPAGTIPTNVWSHVALTYDGSVARLYVNGTLRATSGSFAMAFNNPVRLGYSVVARDSRFLGLLDEVSLYNRALSDAEILSIFNSDTRGKTKP